jgi:hypothetical protein
LEEGEEVEKKRGSKEDRKGKDKGMVSGEEEGMGVRGQRKGGEEKIEGKGKMNVKMVEGGKGERAEEGIGRWQRKG